MRTFLRFLKPYRGLCLLTLLVMALDVAGALYLPTIVADMINIGVAWGDLDFILRKGGLMLGVALVSGGGTLMGCFLCARLSARIGRDMRNALYDKSLTFSASDFEGFGTGSMITRTLNDVNVVQQAFVWSVQMVLPVPLMCVIGVLMAFSIDHVMGLLLIGITLVVILGAVLVTRRASAIFARAQRFLDRISVVVRENITGARVIRAFNKATGEAGRMRRSFTDYAQAAIQANTLFFVLESLAIFFLNLCVVAILWLGGNRIGGGFMEIGDITALTEYAVLILFYVMMAQMVLMLLPRAKVCLERIDAVLSHRPEITDGAGSLPKTEGEAVCAFQHAWFRFADADEATLQDLDFVLRRGQTTAIIGSTGSGKSTIAKLLLRFHDVTQGAICFDGADLRTLRQEDLRQRIAYVPQKAWLFPGGGGGPPPRPGGGPGGLCGQPARGTPGPGGAGGQELLRGPEAAAGHRPGPDQAGRPVHFRRQLLRPGLSDRRGPAPGPAPGGGGQRRAHHRPAGEHHRPRRPDHCPGGWQGGGHRPP